MSLLRLAAAAGLAMVALSGCYVCSLENCTDGCCSEDGVCIVQANRDFACGTGGYACQDCTVLQGMGCENFQCLPRCKPANCASGCCEPNGECRSFNSQTSSTCGRSGQACTSCGSGTSCSSGLCCGNYDTTCQSNANCCPGLNCVQLTGRKACR